MAVQTPTYWKEEKYQPLIVVKTAYGHTVQIPKLYAENWAGYLKVRETMIYIWEQGKQHGYLSPTSDPRAKWAVDLKRVFLEIYKE